MYCTCTSSTSTVQDCTNRTSTVQDYKYNYQYLYCTCTNSTSTVQDYKCKYQYLYCTSTNSTRTVQDYKYKYQYLYLIVAITYLGAQIRFLFSAKFIIYAKTEPVYTNH